MEHKKKSGTFTSHLIYIMVLMSIALVSTLNVHAEYPATFVDLGIAGNFAVLSEDVSSAITSTGNTAITGDIGASPASSAEITGFSLIGIPAVDTFLTSSQVTGQVHAADLQGSTSAMLITAISNRQTAFTAATDATANPAAISVSYLNLGAGTVTTQTLTPGVYTWDTNVDITGDITLDCQGNSSSVFVFQIAQNLNLATTKQIILSGGCQASRIFWAVSGTTNLQASSHFEGTLITGPATTQVTLFPSSTINGRLLGAKTIALQDSTIITAPIDTVPSISSVISDPHVIDASINWTTSVYSDSTVFYGSTSALGSSASNPGLAINHSVFLTGLTSGTLYYFNISSCDALGNCNTAGTYNFTTSSPTPVLTSITLSPAAANLRLTITGSTLQLHATKLDQFGLPISANITYASDNPAVATVNATSGLVTAIGPGSATINAASGAVNAASIITVITDAPILSHIGSRSVTKDSLIDLTLTATSLSGFNLNFSIVGKPATAVFVDNHDGTAMFSWLPNAGDIGVTNVEFTVTDGMKTKTELVAITVNSFQAPTTIPGDIVKNADYNVTLHATSFNNTPIAYIDYTLNNVSGRINGSFGNVLINISGNNILIFHAVDTSGNVETPKTVNAVLDKVTPVISSFTLSHNSVYAGESLTGICSATDNLDSSPITSITGTNAETPGTKTATCTATDDAGNVATANLAYTVNQRPSNGGGGSSSTMAVQQQSSSFSELTEGLHSIDITRAGLAITNLGIQTSKNASDVKITVTQLTVKPDSVTAPPLDKIYGYLSIDHANLENAILNYAKITFKIPKSWVTGNDVAVSQIALYRYASGWDRLSTRLISQDPTYYYLEATSPGLSYFVIGTPASQIPAEPATTPTTTPTTDPAISGSNMTTIAAQPSTGDDRVIPTGQTSPITGQIIEESRFKISGLIVALALFVIIGLIISGYLLFREPNKA